MENGTMPTLPSNGARLMRLRLYGIFKRVNRSISVTIDVPIVQDDLSDTERQVSRQLCVEAITTMRREHKFSIPFILNDAQKYFEIMVSLKSFPNAGIIFRTIKLNLNYPSMLLRIVPVTGKRQQGTTPTLSNGFVDHPRTPLRSKGFESGCHGRFND